MVLTSGFLLSSGKNGKNGKNVKTESGTRELKLIRKIPTRPSCRLHFCDEVQCLMGFDKHSNLAFYFIFTACMFICVSVVCAV